MAAEKEVSLRRASHSTDLMQDFGQMLADEELVDVTLCTEDGSLSAHRILLSSSSSYFRSIFARLAASGNKNQYPVVVLKDIRFVDLKAIIEFIYRGEVIVPQSQLQSIIKTAEGLKVRGLLTGIDTEFEPDDNRKKRRKRKRSRSSKTSGSENESRTHSEASTDEEDDHRTQMTSVTDDRNSISTVGDVEPSRILEQSMTITGDVSPSASSLMSQCLFLRNSRQLMATTDSTRLYKHPIRRVTIFDCELLAHLTSFCLRPEWSDLPHGQPE